MIVLKRYSSFICSCESLCSMSTYHNLHRAYGLFYATVAIFIANETHKKGSSKKRLVRWLRQAISHISATSCPRMPHDHIYTPFSSRETPLPPSPITTSRSFRQNKWASDIILRSRSFPLAADWPDRLADSQMCYFNWALNKFLVFMKVATCRLLKLLSTYQVFCIKTVTIVIGLSGQHFCQDHVDEM